MANLPHSKANVFLHLHIPLLILKCVPHNLCDMLAAELVEVQLNPKS